MSNVVPFPTPAPEPEELLARLKARDPRAVAHVYRAHHRRVRAFARRMVGDETTAEDVVHDVFVALPEAAARFRGDASLNTFLMSIAVNLCRRRLRSWARGRRAVERMRQRDVPDEVRTPEAEARRRQLADALSRGLDTLTLEHREVFVLCAVEERTSQEVADILDIPPGTVRTRLFHARKNLRAFLEREGVR
ncbi:MAG TPA: RNA polymerase sigma factor [Sandaracinaceae bacterium LLY-WYZ-13_1]|nr:RNA polymerase sigma factor [Sandaracinaceae bacterium LLY-WYZ-13_1]